MLVFFQQIRGGLFSLNFTEILCCSDLIYGDALPYTFLFSKELVGLLLQAPGYHTPSASPPFSAYSSSQSWWP